MLYFTRTAVATDLGAGPVPTADDIILELIATGRQATSDEVDTIIAHVAQAPFAAYLAWVPRDLRALLTTLGIRVPARLPSPLQHHHHRLSGQQPSSGVRPELHGNCAPQVKR